VAAGNLSSTVDVVLSLRVCLALLSKVATEKGVVVFPRGATVEEKTGRETEKAAGEHL